MTGMRCYGRDPWASTRILVVAATIMSSSAGFGRSAKTAAYSCRWHCCFGTMMRLCSRPVSLSWGHHDEPSTAALSSRKGITGRWARRHGRGYRAGGDGGRMLSTQRPLWSIAFPSPAAYRRPNCTGRHGTNMFNCKPCESIAPLSTECLRLPGRRHGTNARPTAAATRATVSTPEQLQRPQRLGKSCDQTTCVIRRQTRRLASSGSMEGDEGVHDDDVDGGSRSPDDTTSTLDARRGGRQVAEPGTVYFVATPIGNLEDITLRAMNILQTADVIAAEDTRTTGSLLKLLGVERKGKLLSHHEHNTRRRVPEIVNAAREGKSVAVVSDAGTPGISDPGMELAAACAAEGVRVVPIPGACAAVAAISVSGFVSHEFVFFGFVAGKRGSAVRERKLAEIAQETRTCIMYESPHRIADTLRRLLAASISVSSSSEGAPSGRGSGSFPLGLAPPSPSPLSSSSSSLRAKTLLGEIAGFGGTGREESGEGESGQATGIQEGVDADQDAQSAVEGRVSIGVQGEGAGAADAGSRPIMLARELTKLHEEIYRGTLAEAVARYGTGENDAAPAVKDPRGEFTVVLGPRTAFARAGEGVGSAGAMAALEARLRELVAGGMSTSSAVKMVSKDLGIKKSEVYRIALGLLGTGRQDDAGR